MKITNITKKYKDNTVLNHLNFSFNSSHIVGLIGKNGVGKTTIMKIMNGNIVNFKGKVDFDQNKKIGYLIEHPKLYQDLSGLKNLKNFSNILGVKFDKDYANKIIKAFDMERYINKRVKKYSLGMKQKLAIAVSLINKPHYLILDEPTNGMDPDGSIDVLNTIKDITNEFNMKVLISSHKLEDIELICDRAVFLLDGKFVEDIDMKNTSSHEYTSISFNEIDVEKAKNHLNSKSHGSIKKSGNILIIPKLDNYQNLLKDLANINIFPTKIEDKISTLRDTYFNINKGE
ncbi:phenol-soluble modulin export ABC transporter ATP-binding protein PmtC [Staphylococcus epidermidis]|jgi:ABC transporter, ATP-binding protein|uniref:phenol-soluble modulin export ABC transporter ATP-binding protein PmtC n=1 Tax=Staphylococcus epidermidis TaxID=1282 RepID=UPI00066DFE0B|nr:ABC transporter ATP-binding protein [Staphylococcus epidermidis]MBC3005892.1 ABC transporter ATP-binding protein [Staphylococcus epidermidis]MBC3066026.1 ABC transporter ATP-binding protein [Staphylococcus epidermidis]MBM0807466.1 ABC transporter ATP-binding protein [Staphylococcus epidermidis]MBU5609047.1 ABC transporter ATP-binding protein [Staphylococcus epidermidis]MCG3214995.1 ABC transporter ATP-binding protein [Staphylococcus epidermidis]